MFLVGILYCRIGILPHKLEYGGMSKPVLVALRYVSSSSTAKSGGQKFTYLAFSVDEGTVKGTLHTFIRSF